VKRVAQPVEPLKPQPKPVDRLQPSSRTPPSAVEIAAWVLAAAALLLILLRHLLPALLAGLLVYELVHVLAPRLSRVMGSRSRAKLVAVAVLTAAVVAGVGGAIFGIAAFFRSGTGNLPSLLQKMAEIVESSRAILPAWVLEHLPENADAVKVAAAEWLRVHAREIQTFGAEAGRALVLVLVGMVIGALLALREVTADTAMGPLARALSERAQKLGDAFRRVVFGQVRVSLVNTILTSVYLAIVLPLFGVHLPFTKTIIAITFVAGLLPVVGNLISNSVIFIVGLSVSLPVALGALAYLVVIHKLEYFINARIIGSQIHAHAWELLLAMLAMEAVFGLPGVVAAPIYYAYLKDELASRGLV
jgi:predicted PurR-regulated permease PerM